MSVIEIRATSEEINPRKQTITYFSDVEAGPGLLVLNDQDGDHDLVIVNQVHNGGKVSVLMKSIRLPAKKYNIGEVVAKLITFDN